MQSRQGIATSSQGRPIYFLSHLKEDQYYSPGKVRKIKITQENNWTRKGCPLHLNCPVTMWVRVGAWKEVGVSEWWTTSIYRCAWVDIERTDGRLWVDGKR